MLFCHILFLFLVSFALCPVSWQFSYTLLYSWVEIDSMRAENLAKEHRTMTLARIWTLEFDPDHSSTNTTVTFTKKHIFSLMLLLDGTINFVDYIYSRTLEEQLCSWYHLTGSITMKIESDPHLFRIHSRLQKFLWFQSSFYSICNFWMFHPLQNR